MRYDEHNQQYQHHVDQGVTLMSDIIVCSDDLVWIVIFSAGFASQIAFDRQMQKISGEILQFGNVNPESTQKEIVREQGGRDLTRWRSTLHHRTSSPAEALWPTSCSACMMPQTAEQADKRGGAADTSKRRKPGIERALLIL